MRSYFVLAALVASIAFAVLTRGGYMREFWLPIALLIFVTGAYFFITRKKELRLRSVWKMDIPLLVFLGWAILTYFTSVNRERTIYELVRLLALVAVFLLASYGLQGEKLRKYFLVCVLGIGFLEALYGLLSFASGEQLLGFYWLQDITLGRVSGTFLNNNHFAGYMEMATLAGFGLAAGVSVSDPRERLAKRVIIIMACAITLTGLVLSGSRGAWFSFATVCGLLAPLLIWKVRPSFTQTVLLIGFLLLIAGAFIIGSELDPLQKRIKHMSRIFQDEETTSINRFSIWESCLEMIKDDPLMGKGWGNFQRAFPAYRQSEREKGAHFAHNDYLQIATEAGIPGLLLFLVFILMVFKKGIESLIRNREGPMQRTLPGVLAALLALLVHGFVDFNLMIPSSSITFFALAGIVSGHARETLEPQVEAEESSKYRLERVLAIILLAAFTFRIIQMWTAEIYYQKGQAYEKEGQFIKALSNYEKAIGLLPRNAEYHHRIGKALFDDYLEESSPSFESLQNLEKAFQHYNNATKLEPLYPHHWFKAAMVLHILEEQGVTDIPNPQEYLRRSLEIDPNHPRFLSGSIFLDISNNSLIEARDTFYKLFLIYPSSIEIFADSLFPHKTDLENFGARIAENTEASLNFAGFLYRKDHNDLAEKQIDSIAESQLIELDPVLSARIFDEVGKTEKAKRILYRAWNESEDHSNDDVGRWLAYHYEKSGETDKALEVWRTLIKLHPERPSWNLKYATLADKNKRNDLALRHYKKVVKSDSAKKEYKKTAYMGIGKILQEKGFPEQALFAYERALEIYPDDKDLKHKILKLKMKH